MGFREKLKWIDPFTLVDFLLEKTFPVKGKKTPIQSAVYDIVYLASAFVFAFIIWLLLSLALQTSSPMVIVISPSMQSLYYRGDVAVLQGVPALQIQTRQVDLNLASLQNTAFSEFASATYSNSQLATLEFPEQAIIPNTQGDIIVYNSLLTGEQIIHRAIAKLHAGDGYYFITKGDNSLTNPTFDQDCGKVIERIAGTDSMQVFVEKPCIALYPIAQSQVQGKVLFKIPLIGCFKLWLFDDLPSLLFKGRLPENFQEGGIC